MEVNPNVTKYTWTSPGEDVDDRSEAHFSEQDCLTKGLIAKQPTLFFTTTRLLETSYKRFARWIPAVLCVPLGENFA